MNKLQKTIIVELTAFSFTKTSQVPFAAAVDVNSEKVTSSQKDSRDELVDPTTLFSSYTVKTSDGLERSSKQSIKVLRPDLSTPLSYFKDYLPKVKKEINYNVKTYQLIKEEGITIQASIHSMEACMRYYYAEKKPIVKSGKLLRVPAGNNGEKIRFPVAKKQQPEVIKEEYKIVFKKEMIEFMGERKKTFREDR